jgi:hypothetical protein
MVVMGRDKVRFGSKAEVHYRRKPRFGGTKKATMKSLFISHRITQNTRFARSMQGSSDIRTTWGITASSDYSLPSRQGQVQTELPGKDEGEESQAEDR